jgi:transcription antitermination factor NusG
MKEASGMPVLAREPDLFPADLLDRPDLGEDEQFSWWAMYCRSQREKQLMRRLQSLGVAHYGPLVAKRSRSRAARIRTAYVPLFPGYVFVYGDERARYAALTTDCVSRWLPVADPAALTRDLRHIQHLIEIGAPLTLEARLQPGMRVRIRSGMFLGLEGAIIRRENRLRLLVAVKFLQQGASVLLDDCQVEPAD